MKYIKAEITDVSDCSERPYFAAPDKYSVNCVSEDKIIPMDKTYSDGLNDAWELAKKVILATDDGGISLNDITEIFGSAYCALRDFTYEEALAKIEAYEKEKEIEVGDVVKFEGLHEEKYGVVSVRRCGTVNGIRADGTPFSWNKNDCTKTGKHIDIESLLKEIGE